MHFNGYHHKYKLNESTIGQIRINISETIAREKSTELKGFGKPIKDRKFYEETKELSLAKFTCHVSHQSLDSVHKN